KTWNYLRTTIAILGCYIPLSVLDMLSQQAVAAIELSPISYLLVGVVKRALFRSGMSALGILSLPEVDGIEEGNGNDRVGSGVNIGAPPLPPHCPRTPPHPRHQHHPPTYHHHHH
nr:hypothetical protein [Tanacetum cinerariifolium]